MDGRPCWPAKARKALFVNGNVSVKEFKSNHKELEFNEGRRLTRDLILQPLESSRNAGVLENSNRSTIDGADFQQRSKRPPSRQLLLLGPQQRSLRPSRTRNHRLRESGQNPSQSDVLLQKWCYCTGLGTIDEARKMIGMPPLPNNAGRVIPVPVNNVRWYDPITREWIDSDPKPAAPSIGDPNQPPVDPSADPQRDQMQRLLDALGELEDGLSRP